MSRPAVTREQLLSLAESYAYDRWPGQTVQDDPEMVTLLAMPRIEEWLRVAGIEVES